MKKKEITSYKWLYAIFVGFFIGNTDKLLGYFRQNNSLFSILTKGVLFRIGLSIIITLIFGNGIYQINTNEIKKIFRYKRLNVFLSIILVVICCIGFGIDVSYQLKEKGCMQELTRENQMNCISELNENRFNWQSIISDE